MNQQNQPVTSREYKLALNVDRFADRVEGAKRFWKLLAFLAPQAGFVVYCAQDEEIQHETWYLETPGFELQRHGFNLRVRKDEEKPGYKVTLKYRNADRYISASQDVSSPRAKKKDFKFEEDILTPFTSKFSHSVSLEIETKELTALTTVSEAAQLFPGLAALDISPATPLKTANDFTAHEVVRWIGQLAPGKTPIAPSSPPPDFIVKVCLNFWYLIGQEDDELPLIAEFSFDYDALKNAGGSGGLEQFPPELVAGASRLYLELQEHTSWALASSTTKTAFALEAL